MAKKVTRDEFQRKRMERQRKIRKRRLLAFFIIFLIIALAVCVALSFTVFFPITDISVSGNKKYTSEEILKYSDIEIGDNIFAVNEDKTEKVLKSRLPFIEEITFNRKLPDKLEIKVKDATEYASYYINNKYYTVSRNNWVLSETTEAPKSLIIFKAKEVACKVGGEVEFKNLSQKELLESIITAVTDKKLKLNAVDVTNILGLEIKVENRFTVLLGSSNNIEEKVSHLAVMIEGMDKDKSGTINLSMWTGADPMGTFSEKNTKK